MVMINKKKKKKTEDVPLTWTHEDCLGKSRS